MGSARMQTDFELIYPHDYIEYVIVVANRKATTSVILLSIVRSPLISVWSIVIVVVTVFRVVFQKLTGRIRTTTQRSWSDLFFDSMGRAFGTNIIATINHRPERVLLLGMSFFSVLAGIICSGMLFENCSTYQYSQIVNSIDDLKVSGYEIIVPNRFPSVTISLFQER